MRAVVMDIGCLECHVPSELLGIYSSAFEALAAHPEAQLATTMDSDLDWYGDVVQVIFTEP